MCLTHAGSSGITAQININSHSLCSRVVELVLSRPCKATLYATVAPQSPDHIGQVIRKDALFFCSCRQGKELLSIILQGAIETQNRVVLSHKVKLHHLYPMYRFVCVCVHTHMYNEMIIHSPISGFKFEDKFSLLQF